MIASQMDPMLGEISTDVTSFIRDLPSFRQWPECQHLLLNMLAMEESWIHALPILTCKAVGGEQCAAIPVAAAWTTLAHAANLIDDIQDGDLGLSTQMERSDIALTIAIAWIFAAFQMLDDLHVDPETRSRVATIFANAGFDSSMGQLQDLAFNGKKPGSGDPLQEYWNAVILKSGSIFMAGAAAGAAVGTDSTALVEALTDYGTALGVIRQVIDDCQDIQADAKFPEKQSKLPALLGSMVRGRGFGKQWNRKDKVDPSIPQLLSENPQFLVEAGIPEIIADILLEWRRRAVKSLRKLKPSAARSMLENILDEVMGSKPHGA
jgi:geranylgeranyl pyrophosphate synthase